MSVDTPDTDRNKQDFAYGILTLSDRLSHTVRLSNLLLVSVLNPDIISNTGLASSNFARHYFRNLV